jgi:hypothetical protein
LKKKNPILNGLLFLKLPLVRECKKLNVNTSLQKDQHIWAPQKSEEVVIGTQHETENKTFKRSISITNKAGNAS